MTRVLVSLSFGPPSGPEVLRRRLTVRVAGWDESAEVDVAVVSALFVLDRGDVFTAHVVELYADGESAPSESLTATATPPFQPQRPAQPVVVRIVGLDDDAPVPDGTVDHSSGVTPSPTPFGSGVTGNPRPTVGLTVTPGGSTGATSTPGPTGPGASPTGPDLGPDEGEPPVFPTAEPGPTDLPSPPDLPDDDDDDDLVPPPDSGGDVDLP